jgi:StAR-related lipid transfer protein 10
MEASDNSADLLEKIKDLPEEKQQMVKKLYEKVSQLKELQKEEEGWKEAINKDGYTVYTKGTDSGLNCVKGHGPIEFSADALVKYINTPGNSLKYDQQFKEGKEIENLDLGIECSIGYSRYKGGTMVSDRDFCMISGTFKEEDGKIVIIATSVEHPDCPEVKKVVRAECVIGGWIITPDSEDPEHKCSVYYVTQTNPKGMVPKMFVNKVSKNQGLLPKTINEAMKKE